MWSHETKASVPEDEYGGNDEPIGDPGMLIVLIYHDWARLKDEGRGWKGSKVVVRSLLDF